MSWHGIGITNLASRATAAAAELNRRFRPQCVAVVGIGAYRVAFDRPRAGPGLQPERLETAALWILPNPSGLNANHQLPDLGEAFGALREFVG